MMKIIIITAPEAQSHEAEKISFALEAGVDRVHIRKPAWSEELYRALIESIPEALRPRLTLHDHLHLAEELGVGGVQLNSRAKELPLGFEGSISRSCHTLEEINGATKCNYVTLSPIYDSISKQGYLSSFTPRSLQGLASNVIAMGGITPRHLLGLWQMGFSGAALLGYIWQEDDIESFKRRVELTLRAARWCRNFSLQYITHRTAERSDIDGARAALEGGCRWVQLRLKEGSDEEFISLGRELKRLCDSYSATMLVDDRVDLVKKIGADGVHLGKNDMAPSAARSLLGEGYVIGGTANDLADIDRLIAQGVDYIGMGPFRYTTTKAKLSPIIGIEGYTAAREHRLERGYATPIVAIGGIEIDDIEQIMSSGVQGIALSGTILRAADPVATTKEIVKGTSNNSPKYFSATIHPFRF